MTAPALPLIDLHRHIEGSVRLETVLELARRHRIALPADQVESLRPHVQITEPAPGVMAFIERIVLVARVFADLDACRRVAMESVLDAHAEGLDYVELRFSPWFMASAHALDPAAVTAVVVEGVEQGRRTTGLPVGLIGILSRTYGLDACTEELEALLTRREAIVALDLAGDEPNYPCALFTRHFRRGRDAGWGVTIHAGEAAGAANVWSAIRDLGATRIGHGVRAVEDPALVEHMREHRVGIEANLTSNVQTSTVPDYASHPLRAMLDLGLSASINSDDPAISGITLRHELEVAAPAAGLDAAHVRLAQAHALAMAFLSAEEKTALATRVAGAAAGAAEERP
jgi:adenosine deaminase